MEEKKNKKMNGVEPANKNVEWSKPEIRVEEKWGKKTFLSHRAGEQTCCPVHGNWQAGLSDNGHPTISLEIQTHCRGAGRWGVGQILWDEAEGKKKKNKRSALSWSIIRSIIRSIILV